MTKIKTKTAYEAIKERIKELKSLVNDDTPITCKDAIELDLLTSMVEEYEKKHPQTSTKTRIEEIRRTYMQLGELCHLVSVEFDKVINPPDEIEVAQSFSHTFDNFSNTIKKTQNIYPDDIKHILDEITHTFVAMWKGYDIPCRPFYCGLLEMYCDELSEVHSKLKKLLETRLK